MKIVCISWQKSVIIKTTSDFKEYGVNNTYAIQAH